MKPVKIAANRVETFFLRPARAYPLAALRVGLSLLLLLQAYMLRYSLVEFFGHDGLLQGELAAFLASPNTPRVEMFERALAPFGLGEVTILYLFGGAYIASLCALLAGFYTRIAAFLAWFIHWLFLSSGVAVGYGVDLYAHVFLLYLIFVPSGDVWSLDRFLGRTTGRASPYARLGLRVMQLQLCITYLISAWDKAKGEQWRNGELIWRSVTVPLYRQFDLTWLAQWPLFLKFGGWSCIALEAGYCIFIWPRRTRWLWISGMLALHGGIAVFMGLQLFGLEMCVLTLAVFGVPARPIRFAWLRETALRPSPAAP